MLNNKILLFLCALLLTPAHAGQWQEGNKLSFALPDAMASMLGDEIYILSGTLGQGRRSFFESYNARFDGFRALTPIPQEVQNFALTAGDGRVYVLGGYDRKEQKPVDNFLIYAPESALWMERAAMPEARRGHHAAFYKRSIYIFGGEGETNDILRYDIDRALWERQTAMPHHISAMAVAQKDNRIVFIGGRDIDGNDTAYVQDYNFETGAWQELPALPYALSYAMAGFINDELHVVGGFSQAQGKVLDTHFVLTQDGWRGEPALPQALHRAAYAIYDNKFFIFGGAIGGSLYALFTASDQSYIYVSEPE